MLSQFLSFDLVNEPPNPGEHGMTRKNHATLIRCTVASIRAIDPNREMIIGEFGCFNRTPNDIAMRWFTDLLSVFKEFKWGYAMWNFQGPFGIIEHGRPGGSLEFVAGYHVDRALLDLMLESRVSQ